MARSELSRGAARNTYKVANKNREYTTVWSFPERGAWATHNPQYRGNFAPQIARNVIEMYSEKGDDILDPMVGGGTTLIEARLLCRNALGLDINPEAIEPVDKRQSWAMHGICRFFAMSRSTLF